MSIDILFDHPSVYPALAPIFAWCGGSAAASPAGPITALLFLTGLVGGAAHCGPMCGPFVLAQTAGSPASVTLQQLKRGLLLPYHLGRLVTYAALGATVATLGAGVIAAGPFHLAVALLLAFAALVFLGRAAERLAPGIFPPEVGALAAVFGARIAGLSRPLLTRERAAYRFALGVVLGFLPCGFLYAALAAAAATGNAAAGALAMGGFALGTVPSLVLVGVGGAALAARWRRPARRLAAPVFLFDGAVLLAMAFSAALPV